MSPVHVAVAAIVNADNEVLVARRPDHVHQGGLWEFPGGKLEPGEDVTEALHREIQEELGIDIGRMSPLIQLQHDYGDKSVLLDVWRVQDFQGEASGMEGQPIAWQKIDQLQSSRFPAANRGIIRALQLPDRYMITGQFSDLNDFQQTLERALQNGIRLVQLRAKHITDSNQFIQLAALAKEACASHGAQLLLNTSIELFSKCDAHGLHLSSHALSAQVERPVGEQFLLSASCHNAQQVQHARALAADIILLSPVKPTSSHPGVPGIGWDEFSRLTRLANCPLYALGGMQPSDITQARCAGAQGIAAISALWPHE